MSNIRIYLGKVTQLQGLKNKSQGIEKERSDMFNPSREVGEKVNVPINFFTFYGII